MSNPGGHGNRHSIRRVATEFGQFFDEWVRRPAAGGWSSPVRELDAATSISWHNSGGTVLGSAKFREPLSNFSLSSSGTYSNQHTVHIRALNSNQFFYYEIGPATALHNAGGVADHKYAIVAGNIGLALPFLAIIKVFAGGFGIAPLTSVGGSSAIIQRGDVVSLAYRWNSSGGGSADLSVMVNGKALASVTDSSSAYDIGTVADGRFGLYGDLMQAITTIDMGHLLQEWWVTDGYQTFEEVPPIYPGLSRGLRLAFMGVQRFTNSPTPKIKALVSGQLTRCRWTYKRRGGCGTLSAEFRYPSDDDPVAASFRAPTNADWSSGNWLGGELVLSLPFSGFKLDEGQAPAAQRDAVWRGRVTKLQVDTDTRTVKVKAEGLFKALSERFIDTRDYQDTIRNIIIDVLTSTAKSATLGSMFRYNPAKVVGLSSILDLSIALSVRAQSAKSVLDKVTAYLPEGVVWGVDREGDFFLDQQPDPWTVGHDGAGVQSFDATKEGVDFDTSMDLGRIKTIVTVMGKEDSGAGTTTATATAGRVSGRAESDRASAIFGERAAIHTDSAIEEAGLAFKVALARLKAATVPRITARLKVAKPLAGLHALWQSLTVSAPRVMVRDSSDASRRLRFYDDVASYSMKEQGSQGADVSLASTSTEQSLERAYLVHAAMKFDFAHSGAGNDDFLFGRPNDAGGATQFGWGSLWWEGTGGKLEWRYSDTGSTTWVLDTGIVVPTTGSGTIVNFTVWRDGAGTFRFYDGNTLTNTVAHPSQTQRTSETGPWRFFKHNHTLPGGFRDGDFAARHFWVFNAAPLEALFSASFSAVQEFIARNNVSKLHRNDTHGLLLYLPFRERGSLSASPWSGVQGAPPTVAIARVVPTVAKSGQAGTPDGDDFEGVDGGLVVGTEKKFGGPFVYNAERTSYDYDARSGMLTRDFTLGEFPLDGFATIARVEAQVEKMADILKRVTETL